MRIDGPTNPFHVSRVYGVQPPLRLTAPRSIDPITPTEPRPVQPTNAQRLVAGGVPGRVDFSGDSARPSDPATIPMYRHPADRNAAATAVAVGRTVDIRG